MRILHVFKTYYPESRGGIEETIHQLSAGSIRRGLDVDIFTLSGLTHGSWTTAEGYAVHAARRLVSLASTGLSIDAFGSFRRLADRADVIHYHFPWPFMDILHFSAGLRRPSLITYHSDIVRQRLIEPAYRPLMHRFLSSVDAVVATSPNYLQTSPVLQDHRAKVSVIPIGITSPDTSEAQNPSKWSKALGNRFFLFVGALRYYKGLHILLDAAQGTPFPIAIAGAGPIEDELKAQAKRLGLTNIHFLGQISDQEKSDLLATCLAVVFPSHLRSEAFGVSLVEGAAHAKPLLSSEIGTGTSYINLDGETGFVVPPGNADALRASMTRLWSDPEFAARFGRAARRRYEKLFTADLMVDRYVDLYARLLSLHR